MITKIYSKLFITIYLATNFLEASKQETISPAIVLDIPRNVRIENLQKDLINRLKSWYTTRNIDFIAEAMPHITMVEINKLPLHLMDQLKKALKEAREEFFKKVSYGIHGISITEGIELLGRKENTDKFLAVHIDETRFSYQKIEQLRNIIIKRLKKNGISEKYYKMPYTWTPHITLGKADKPLPREWSPLKMLYKVGGTPFRADSFSLYSGGSRQKGWKTIQEYPLYPTKKIKTITANPLKKPHLITVEQSTAIDIRPFPPCI